MPQRGKKISKHKWFGLLDMLRSAITDIPGAEGIFIRLQNVLKNAEGRKVILTTYVHGKLNLWRHLIRYL